MIREREKERSFLVLFLKFSPHIFVRRSLRDALKESRLIGSEKKKEGREGEDAGRNREEKTDRLPVEQR